MCQLIVQKSQLGLQNPIDMVFHVQPWMMIAVLPFAIFFEGWSFLSRLIGLESGASISETFSMESAEEKAAFLYAMNAILLGAIMAFFMEVAEYLVVTYTSSLTLSVAGIFKVLCFKHNILRHSKPLKHSEASGLSWGIIIFTLYPK